MFVIEYASVTFENIKSENDAQNLTQPVRPEWEEGLIC